MTKKQATWASFAVGQEATESTYNQALGGKLEAGYHEGVKITGISPGEASNGSLFAKLVWEKDGLTKIHNVFLQENDFETGELKVSKKYFQLIGGLIGNGATMVEFGNAASHNPQLLNNLVGMVANIKIGLPYKGNKLVNVEGGVQIVDIQTGEQVEDTRDVYATNTEAFEHAKEEGIKIKMDEVLFINLNDEAQEKNVQLATDALNGTTETAESGAAKPIRASF